MKRQFIALGLAVCMFLGLFAACSPKPSSSGNSDNSYKGVELTFLRHSGYDADWMASKADEFYNQTGIRVNIEQVAYSDSHNKFVVDASSDGGSYDLYATTEYWLPEFYEGGWIVDINPYLNDSTLYDADYNTGDISKSMLQLNTIDGKLLAMPWKFNSQMLVYNTDFMQTAPANWDELLAAAKKQKEESHSGILLPLSKASAMDVFLNLLYQDGGTFLSDDLKTCNLDSAQSKEALEYLVELSKYTSDGAVNSQWPEVGTLFEQGNSAMSYMINTQVGNIMDSTKSNVFNNVGFAEEPGKVTNSATSSTWGICITKNCKHPEAAFLFIQYITNKENMKDLVVKTNGGTTPVRSSLLTDPELQKSYPWFDVMNSIATKPGHTFAYPKTTQCASIMDILAGHVQNAVNGAETVGQALSSAKSEIEALL